jgi:Protein of unknown function (DUF4199)
MEQKKPISHLVAGLLIAAVLIICRLVIYFSGIEETGVVAWLPIIILIAGLIIFINLYGNANNNQVGFGNLFGYGFKTTATVTLVVIVFMIIFIFLFPDTKEKGFEMARQKMEEKGNLTNDEIDKRLELARKMFWVLAIGGVLLIYAIVGAIGSAIGASITKKKPVNPMDQLGI